MTAQAPGGMGTPVTVGADGRDLVVVALFENFGNRGKRHYCRNPRRLRVALLYRGRFCRVWAYLMRIMSVFGDICGHFEGMQPLRSTAVFETGAGISGWICPGLEFRSLDAGHRVILPQV